MLTETGFSLVGEKQDGIEFQDPRMRGALEGLWEGDRQNLTYVLRGSSGWVWTVEGWGAAGNPGIRCS